MRESYVISDEKNRNLAMILCSSKQSNRASCMGQPDGEAVPLGLIPIIDVPGNPVLPDYNAADRYTERISYDKNSNITSIERYGMNNQRHYGLIDSLVITRNGNQLKTIEDHAEKHLTYTGASDFYDGSSYGTEYYYNANGALESDINRDIDLIQYDALGNTRCIYYFGQNQIEYIYAADGTKLRTIHRPASSMALTDSIDYIGNLILKNGQPSMYLFDGGYATFNQNGAINGWHYYIQDYMGNNRMVVNKNGTVEQITHYYPYGGVIGDISTNESVQKYKFEGKELDRTFGLDNYDIHARQYFAMAPMWDRIDPLAEKYYGISPYAYCGGDPVNLGDYDGESSYKITENGYLSIIEGSYDDGKCHTIIGKDGNTIDITDRAMVEAFAIGASDNKVNKLSSYTSENNTTQAENFFKFMADNSTVEWVIAKLSSIKGKDVGNKVAYQIGTTHDAHACRLGIGSYGDGMTTTKIFWSDIEWEMHSHPNNQASEGYQIASGASEQDMNHAYAFSRKDLSPSLYVYNTKLKIIYQYNQTNSWVRFNISQSNKIPWNKLGH